MTATGCNSPGAAQLLWSAAKLLTVLTINYCRWALQLELPLPNSGRSHPSGLLFKAFFGRIAGRCAASRDFLPQSPWLESPWFSGRELGSQTGCWQRVGGVFGSHVPLEQRLCVPVSSPGPVLICSLEQCSVPEGIRKPSGHVAGGEELGKGWWLWMQVSRGRGEWMSEAASAAVSVLPPSPRLIPTFLLSYHSLKSSLCVGSFFKPFSLSCFLPDLLFSPHLLFPCFQSPLLCFHPHASEAGHSLRQMQWGFERL